MFTRVFFIEASLDIVTAAWLLEITRNQLVENVTRLVEEAFLADPTVLCLGCGGEGRVSESNFAPYKGQTATEQVWKVIGRPRRYAGLVSYVQAIERGEKKIPDVPVISLFPYVFSLCDQEPLDCFYAALSLVEAFCGYSLRCHRVFSRKHHLAMQYINGNQQSSGRVSLTLPFIHCDSPFRPKTMFVIIALPNMHPLLHALGSEISMVCGSKKKNRWTISGRAEYLQDLHACLLEMETGWTYASGDSLLIAPPKGSLLVLLLLARSVLSETTADDILVQENDEI